MKAATLLLVFFLLSMMVNSSEGSFTPSKFSATFTQEYKSAVTGKVKRSDGSIDYQFPGMLRFEMQKPSPIIFITRENQSWFYRPPFNKGELGETKYNVPGGLALPRFFDSLSKGLRNNEFFKVKKLNKKTTEILFNKSSQVELTIKKAKILFRNRKQIFKNIQEIELHYVDNKVTKILFNKIKNKKRFSPLLFRYNQERPPQFQKTK